MSDPWEQGFIAARDHGATYAENPLEGKPGATAWAFGCSEGFKERNRMALRAIMNELKEESNRCADI